MKRNSTLFFAALALALFFMHPAYATIIRVNNNPGSNAQYASAQTAQDNANTGDTLHIEPSVTSYGNLNLTKNLTLVGNGYFLTENAGLQVNTNTSKFGFITFAPGSEQSKITGLTIESGVGINASNITVERNYFTLGSDYSPYNSNYQVSVNGNVNHIYIIQNYINGVVYSYNGAASFVYILNNYIGVAMKFQGDDTNMYVINNVFFGSGYISTVSSALLQNNIIRGYSAFNATTSLIQNNLCEGVQFPATDGNQVNVNMTNVFDLSNPSTDAKYQLKAGSPAIGAGVGGVDCGMFATPATLPPGYTAALAPYKLSGIPNVPSIYQLNATVGGNTLNVTISTRSNN